MLNDDGSTQPMVMLVAALIFAAAVGVLLSQARDQTETETAHAQPVRAADVAALLVDSAGMDTGGDRLGCSDIPDDMARFGLQGDGTPGDGLCKIRHLQDGNVKYEKVLEQLQFPQGQGMHIRFQPVLDDLERIQERDLLGLDVAYVGAQLQPLRVQSEIAVLESVARNVMVYNSTTWLGMGSCAHELCADAMADAFDAMVIGTQVDHAALDRIFRSGSGGGPGVAAWFTSAPRTLIVYPSTAADDEWLAGARAQATGWTGTPNNRPLAQPDAGHMLLHEPNRLAWRYYDTTTDLRPLVGGFVPVFAAIGDPADPIAHIPSQRAFGEGQLFFVHADLAAPTGASGDEGKRLLHNLLTRHDQQLWLDFGGTAPTSASSTIRWTEVESPDLYTRLPSAQAVRVHVHVFQDASQTT